MLAKVWKKLLLAICIIACLFNITYKLVNRISLEKVISTQQEGVNIKELLNITDENPVVTNVNNVSVYNAVTENTAVEPENNEQVVNPDEQPVDESESENSEEGAEGTEESPQPGEPGEPMTVTDFIDRVIDGSFEN